jgi:hypothetical protein
MSFLTRFIHDLGDAAAHMADRFDSTTWAILGAVVVVFGYMMLRGNAIRGG